MRSQSVSGALGLVRDVAAAGSCALLFSSLTSGIEIARAGDIPAGIDFQVNTYTTGGQGISDVAHLSDGSFAIVWMSGQDGDESGVFGQRFHADGTANGSEFQVNTYTTDEQESPSLSADSSGGFVVTWASRNQGVYAQRYDSAGNPVGGEIAVYETPISQLFQEPKAVHDNDDGFAVLWSAPSLADPDGALLARRFDAGGAAIGTEFEINSYTTGGTAVAEVSRDTAGQFVVAWTGASNVFARRFDAAWSPVGTEFVVNTYTTGSQALVRVGHDASGGFLVAWQGEGPEGIGGYARRYDSSGSPVGGQVALDPDASALQLTHSELQDVMVRPDGSFLAIWTYWDSLVVGQTNNRSAYGRRFAGDATPLGLPFYLNDHLPHWQWAESGSSDSLGNVVVTWVEGGSFSSNQTRDGSATGVFARRFCSASDPTCEICPGFDDSIDSDVDGTPDGCDPCTNAGPREAVKARAEIRVKDRTGIPQRASSAVFNADFYLPGGSAAFGAIDPISQGMRIRLETPFYGGSIVDSRLLAGAYAGRGTAGWKSKGSGTKWIYLDTREGVPTPDFFKLTLLDRSRVAPNLVSVRARGKHGLYETSPRYIPLKASIALGDGASAASGLCGEATFDPAECTHAYGGARKIRCSR